MQQVHEIEFVLNGKKTLAAVPLEMSALDMIRGKLGLTGTKYGCGEGECGACTIEVDGKSANACLMFAVDCDGRELMTIEGVGGHAGLDRLQKSFVEHWAVQCGYCIPGMVMQARQIVRSHPAATTAEIKRGLEGNICRCTGYIKIIDAIAAITAATVENTVGNTAENTAGNTAENRAENSKANTAANSTGAKP